MKKDKDTKKKVDLIINNLIWLGGADWVCKLTAILSLRDILVILTLENSFLFVP